MAIILVNWRGAEDTIACLDSLARLNYPDFSVYIVDNNSPDDSVYRIARHLKGHSLQHQTRLIESSVNSGFAGGNNVGIKQALSDGYVYFWLLNNDTTVEPGTLSALIEVIVADQNVGMVGSKIYYAGSCRLNYAGGVLNGVTGRGYSRGKNQLDLGAYDAIADTDYVSGCSLLTSKRLIETVGLMREDYFLYYEETDWNLRAKQHGWRLVYQPKSVVHHKVGASSGIGKRNPPTLIYLNLRNRFTMMQRVGNTLQRVLSLLYLHFQLFAQFKMIMNRDRQRLLALRYLFRGYIHSIARRMGPPPALSDPHRLR